MASESNSQHPKRGWQFLLIASLGLNLLVAGAIAGHFFSDKNDSMRGKAGPKMSARSGYGLRMFIGELPREKRAELLRSAKRGGYKIEGLRKEVNAKHDSLIEILSQPELNGDRLRATLSDLVAIQGNAQKQSLSFLASAIESLSVEERSEYVKKLVERREKNRRRFKEGRK